MPRRVLAVEQDAAAVGASSPAMTRSSVVLPEPEGPSRAISSPGRVSSETPSSAGVAAAKRLETFSRLGCAMAAVRSRRRVGRRTRVGRAPFERTAFSTSVTRASSASSEATAKAPTKSYSL